MRNQSTSGWENSNKDVTAEGVSLTKGSKEAVAAAVADWVETDVEVELKTKQGN